MELREPIELINKKLLEDYGYAFNDKPNFKLVFSEDQYEKRLTGFTDEGFELLVPEVRLLPKYKQWVTAKYILERLVPVTGETDLTEKVSYEPAWIFQDKHQNYLPPFFDGCKLIIDSLLEKSGQSGHAKYKDKNVSKEERLIELKKVEDQLFGNETDLTDNLHYGSGVSVPEMPSVPETESKLIH